MAFAEREGSAGAIGGELLDYTGLVFEYWHDYKDGKLTRERFVAWMAPLRQDVQATLQRAIDAQLGHVSGSCADILCLGCQFTGSDATLLGVEYTP